MLVDYVRVSAWTNDGGAGTGTALRSNLNGRCIDIPGANPVDGARLQIYDCNGTAAQQWTVNGDGTIRAMGKCMDAAAAGTANGTAVQLYTCNGTGAQRFTLTAAGDLVNIAANRCVDIVDAQHRQRRATPALGLRRRRQPEVDPFLTAPSPSPRTNCGEGVFGDQSRMKPPAPAAGA